MAVFLQRFALLALMLLDACSAIPGRPDPPGLPRPVPIYVIDREWHTEIGLRTQDLSGPLAELATRFPGAGTLVFGFGDRHYLADPDPDFGDMLLATLPAPGALLVTGLAAPPEQAFGGANVVRLALTAQGAGRAEVYLWNSFAHDAAGGAAFLRAGPYPGSLFYAGAVTYSLAHTCNTWTVEVLAAGGAAVSADGVLLASQAMARARAAGGAAD